MAALRSKPRLRATETVRSYLDSCQGAACVPCGAGHARRTSRASSAEHLRAFLLAEELRTSAASAAVHFRNLRVFFGWLAREDERTNPNPMDRVEGPKVTKKAKAFFTDEELSRLLKTCQGSSFADRRDTAILRILIDTGLRVSGLAGLRFDLDDEARNDVFLTQRRLRIRLKGGDETWVPIGKKAAAALDRYIRVRARHDQASSPWLWLGVQGHNTAHMTDSGIRDMVGRRGEQAGHSERPPAPLPPILRGHVARVGRLHRRPHAHHRLEDLRHGARVHRSPRHRPCPRRARAPQPGRPHLN